MHYLFLLLLFCFTGIIKGERNSRTFFDGYKVIRMFPDSDDQMVALKEFYESNPEIDFWTHPDHQHHPVDVMTSTSDRDNVLEFVREQRMRTEVLIDDVENEIRRLYPQFGGNGNTQKNASFNFETYHRLSSIYNHLDQLAAQRSTLVEVITIGKTHEKRPLKVIKISTPSKDGNKKPAIWIEGGIHAREWISPPTVLYIIKMLTSEDADPQANTFLEELDWYLIPVSNPDGYEYTHTRHRMWRKTRSNHGRFSRFCRGADPNRNWNIEWKKGDSVACSNIFRGVRPFSEVEVRAAADKIMELKNEIRAYLSFHSYSQLVLIPYGYTDTKPDNYKEMFNLANKMSEAMQVKHNTTYKVGTVSDTLYYAYGTSMDWAKSIAGIKYSYTVELRDKGNHGFLLPAEQIIPTAAEAWDGVKVLAQQVIDEEHAENRVFDLEADYEQPDYEL